MRKRIFTRILSLLALLIVLTGTVMSLFQISVHRRQQISNGRHKIVFLAKQFETLLMWDDRVAMRQTLSQIVEDEAVVRYAFVSRRGKVVAHSFPSGIPTGLLGLPAPSPDESQTMVPNVSEFKIKDDGIVYDLTIPLKENNAVLHLGLDRGQIDRAAIPSIVGIGVICGLFFLLLIYPCLKVANAITREVDEMTARLKESNLALEERVSKRTAALREANQQLEEGREHLAVTLRSIGDGVITTDVDKKIRLINRMGEVLTGWPQEEAIGRPLTEVFQIVAPDSRCQLENPADVVLDTGAILNPSSRTLLIRRDGTKRSIAHSSAPIRDADSQIIGVVLVFRDVTEKDRLEAEMQRSEKLESIGVLAGGIAHDFNNFLAAIQGNIDLAQLVADTDHPAYEYLKHAEKATTMASDLALRLLTFSKGNAPIKQASEIDSIIREAAKLALSGATTRCVFDIDPDLPAVYVDAGQIGQVFHNLLLNADQAMPDGGEISVRCQTVFAENVPLQKKSGAYVQVILQDQGVGIPEQQLAKIFDPFFTTKTKGTGLGLAVVHSILKNHGGNIEVDSRVGEGTIFTLYLPTTGDRPNAQRGTSPVVAGGKGRILVMDDEEMLRSLLSSLLTRVGYEVTCAIHGEQALDLFLRARADGKDFNLLILDLTIPGGIGGIETLRRIRDRAGPVKAIATSGYSSDPVIANPERYGFDASISKPFRIHEVCKIVQSVIAQPHMENKQTLLH